ncbi:hypothetical protein HAX54_022209 [Datura stramonium]|uniref:Uncharacterized protein n=1 Tax=Datura stramonium TaxID=4076 RepID=A0ABS8Y4C3_DATST|nr:hypothetical protein [Datura stramonium]
MKNELDNNGLGKKGIPPEMEHTALSRSLQFLESATSFPMVHEHSKMVDSVEPAPPKQNELPHQNHNSKVGIHLAYVPPAYRDGVNPYEKAMENYVSSM